MSLHQRWDILLKSSGWSDLSLRCHPAVIYQLQSWSRSSLVYAVLSFGMQSFDEFVRVQCNKNKQARWHVPVSTFTVPMCHFVASTPFTDWSPFDANVLLLGILLCDVPPIRHPFLRIERSACMLPKMYIPRSSPSATHDIFLSCIFAASHSTRGVGKILILRAGRRHHAGGL